MVWTLRLEIIILDTKFSLALNKSQVRFNPYKLHHRWGYKITHSWSYQMFLFWWICLLCNPLIISYFNYKRSTSAISVRRDWTPFAICHFWGVQKVAKRLIKSQRQIFTTFWNVLQFMYIPSFNHPHIFLLYKLSYSHWKVILTLLGVHFYYF